MWLRRLWHRLTRTREEAELEEELRRRIRAWAESPAVLVTRRVFEVLDRRPRSSAPIDVQAAWMTDLVRALRERFPENRGTPQVSSGSTAGAECPATAVSGQSVAGGNER